MHGKSKADVLDELISDCGAVLANLKRLEQAAIMNVVKWGLQAEAVRLEDVRAALQRLAKENRDE